MKKQLLYVIYAFLGIAACVLASIDLLVESIILRWMGLFLIFVLYFKQKGIKGWIFYLATFFSGIGETYIILGFENYPSHVILPFFMYYWLMFFMIKKSAKSVKYKISLINVLTLIISTILVAYLVISVLALVVPKMKSGLYLTYLYAANFSLVIFYMGVLSLSKYSYRYIWLLFLMTSFIIATISVGLEAHYYPSEFLRQVIYIAEIISHIFLLKFLISSDKERVGFSYIENKI